MRFHFIVHTQAGKYKAKLEFQDVYTTTLCNGSMEFSWKNMSHFSLGATRLNPGKGGRGDSHIKVTIG